MRYFLVLISVVLYSYSTFAAVKTYEIKGFILSGFKDEPQHDMRLETIKNNLLLGLKRYKYRLSLNQMNYFAEYLTDWYKSKGLLFHKVIIPPQELKNKKLKLKLIPGVIGDINVRGNVMFDSDDIVKPFLRLKNKPVIKNEVEEALLILNDTPGLNVFTFFSRGKEKNETRVNIKVQEENRIDFNIKADNYGVESTGENRLLAQISYNNPFGRSDQFKLGLLGTDESIYGSISYRTPMWNQYHVFNISVSNNRFDLSGDFTFLNVNGETRVSRIGVDHTVFRGYQQNQKISWFTDKKESNLTNSAGLNQLQKDEESLGFGLNGFISNSGSDYNYQFYLGTYYGQYKDGFNGLNGTNFSLNNAMFNTQFNVVSSNSYFHSNISLFYRLQVSSDNLPAYEKFSLTGIDAVRALEPGVLSTDEGELLRVSWHWINPKWFGGNEFSKNTRLTLFYDWARGNNSQATNKESVRGYGVSLGYDLSDSIQGKFVYAKSSDIDISTISEKESSHAYAELVYRF